MRTSAEPFRRKKLFRRRSKELTHPEKTVRVSVRHFSRTRSHREEKWHRERTGETKEIWEPAFWVAYFDPQGNWAYTDKLPKSHIWLPVRVDDYDKWLHRTVVAVWYEGDDRPQMKKFDDKS